VLQNKAHRTNTHTTSSTSYLFSVLDFLRFVNGLLTRGAFLVRFHVSCDKAGGVYSFDPCFSHLLFGFASLLILMVLIHDRI